MKSTVWIDGILYTTGAMFIFSQGYFSTEEAYKYCSPTMLFWIKFTLGALASGAAGLKGFRSMTFSRLVSNPQQPPTQ